MKMKGYSIYIGICLLLVAFSVAKEVKADTCEVALESGWNLISTPLDPANTSVDHVLSSIAGQYRDIWERDSSDITDMWKHYHPALTSFGDLSDIELNKGYWLYLNQSTTLTITGTPVSTSQAIQLKIGWNLIGWPFTYAERIPVALSSLVRGVHYSQVSRFNPATQAQEDYFGQDPGADQFDIFEPGKAYYIYALQDCQLTFAPDTTPPGPPTVDPVTTPTNESIQTLSGTKEADTSIWINGVEKVPLDEFTTWSVSILLVEGDNELNVTAKDRAGNESAPPTTVNILLDTIPPSAPAVTDDGATTNSPDRLHATWTESIDDKTNVVEYQYSIGTTPEGIDVVGWTSNGLMREVTHAGLNLIHEQTYYINVKAKDVAGNWSGVGSSDGIQVIQLAPLIYDVTPPDGNLYEVGDTISINGKVKDNENDRIFYKIVIDGQTVKEGEFQGTGTFSYDWDTLSEEIDIHHVTIYAKDAWNNGSSLNRELYLARKAVSLPQQ